MKLLPCAPPTPAQLIAAFEGDMEAILAKSLCIDPAQRLQSVQQLHDELERYFFGYPILTRPASPWTHARKWVRRNRLAAAFGCVLLLVVFFSILGVVRQAAEASRKRQAAQTRLHELVRLTPIFSPESFTNPSTDYKDRNRRKPLSSAAPIRLSTSWGPTKTATRNSSWSWPRNTRNWHDWS